MESIPLEDPMVNVQSHKGRVLLSDENCGKPGLSGWLCNVIFFDGQFATTGESQEASSLNVKKKVLITQFSQVWLRSFSRFSPKRVVRVVGGSLVVCLPSQTGNLQPRTRTV